MATLFMTDRTLIQIERLMKTPPLHAEKACIFISADALNQGIGQLPRFCESDYCPCDAIWKEAYREIIDETFSAYKQPAFKKRLLKLKKTFDGYVYASPFHAQRFMTALDDYLPQKLATPKMLAIIYLLTAEHGLWLQIRENIRGDAIAFESVKLKSISLDAYALYQVVKTIYKAVASISIDEIADETLVSKTAFKVMIHGLIIAKYDAANLPID